MDRRLIWRYVILAVVLVTCAAAVWMMTDVPGSHAADAVLARNAEAQEQGDAELGSHAADAVLARRTSGYGREYGVYEMGEYFQGRSGGIV